MSKVIKLSSREPYVLCFLVFALCLIFSVVSSEAKVTGSCSNCHTMHGSQTPAPPQWTGRGWTPGATHAALLVATCVGCHSNTGAGTILSDNTPVVLNIGTPPTAPLAGGNFYYITSDDAVEHAKGHNVAGIDAKDVTLGLTPPGGSILGSQLTCSGSYGCHGHNGRQSEDTPVADETQAVKGAHHGDDSVIDGSTVAKSYRFLLGITGKEDSNWELEPSTAHNEYKGDTTFSTHNTISYLCGECHGNFHSDAGVGNASPWLRHPTDIFLPQTGEYATYNPTTTYNNLVPVAYTDFNNPSRATAVIMCLSCHRAHASPFFKMMRWDYKSDNLSEALSGCNVCHTSKN